jgi:hypothetical protein
MCCQVTRDRSGNCDGRHRQLSAASDVGYWHFSEVVPGAGDVRRWGYTGSDGQKVEPTRWTQNGHGSVVYVLVVHLSDERQGPLRGLIFWPSEVTPFMIHALKRGAP